LNLPKLSGALELAIDDPDNAGRVVLVYVSQTSGIFTFRPGCGGWVNIGGDDSMGAGPELEAAVDKLWPDAPPRARQLITILAHAAGKKRGIGALLGGGADDD
jgi:hypothetical protein